MSTQLSDEAKAELEFLNTAINENKDAGPIRFAIYGMSDPEDLLELTVQLDDALTNMKDASNTVRAVIVLGNGMVIPVHGRP